MKKQKLFIVLWGILFFCLSPIYGQRDKVLLNDNWSFRFSHDVAGSNAKRVDLPHTWNTEDALAGKLDYKRGIGNYTKKLKIEESQKGKRLFLHFEGAYSVANVFINGEHLGEHRGGYGAFNFEITDAVKYGEENEIWVRVNNAEQLDIMPLVGDFNFYGGIYRNVWLITTNATCISPLNYASPGVQLFQEKVSRELADVKAQITLSNGADVSENIEVKLVLKDNTKIIQELSNSYNLESNKSQLVNIPFQVVKPRLWNGTKDPFMYQVEVSLLKGGEVIDKIIQPLGLRYFHIDPDKGFFLNGEHVKLQGVCRHQDRAERGNALLWMHHKEDMDLMVEMGANAARLAHYPQSTDMYNLMDENGFIVWAEIPFVGPGGYLDKGFIDQESFKENGKEQLKELIRQHYNHPSICMWGMFNEVKEKGDNPIEYIKELDKLSKEEDPYRPTTSASNQGGKMNHITDLIAWNRYDGWYGSTPNTLAQWLDATHSANADLCIGISEYGAGASVYHQQEELKQTSPASFWHPENWQTYYHIENWQIIAERPFVWGSFVWNMFDFGAAHRREGDRIGINDKGLVTFDRKVRKDAFFFYKANWNAEPMIHIAGKRNLPQSNKIKELMVFSNLENLELFVNGKSVGKAKPDKYSIVKWKELTLQQGRNTIEVVGKSNKNIIRDKWIID